MNDLSGFNLLTIVCFNQILRVNPRYGFYQLLIGAVIDLLFKIYRYIFK